MNWKMGFFDKVSDFLWFLAYICIAINTIILTILTLCFTAKSVPHLWQRFFRKPSTTGVWRKTTKHLVQDVCHLQGEKGKVMLTDLKK